jgi:hypothetical protein
MIERQIAFAYQRIADGFYCVGSKINDPKGACWKAAQGAQGLANMHHQLADAAGEPRARDREEAMRG